MYYMYKSYTVHAQFYLHHDLRTSKQRRCHLAKLAEDTWLPDWTEDASLACKSWATDKSWGALQRGPLEKSANWFPLEPGACATARKAGLKADWPLGVFASRLGCTLNHLAGRSLQEACDTFWAQLNCAKTCGCSKSGRVLDVENGTEAPTESVLRSSAKLPCQCRSKTPDPAKPSIP